jgi:hypothetical protein
MSSTALAVFVAVSSEDSTGAGQVDIAPVEIHGFGHTSPSADEKSQQRPLMRRSSGDQPLDLVRK